MQCNLLWQQGVRGSGPEERVACCEEYLQSLEERIEQHAHRETPAQPDRESIRPFVQGRTFVALEMAGEHATLWGQPGWAKSLSRADPRGWHA